MSDLIRREDVNDLIKQICDACGEGEKYNGVMCRCCRFDDFIGVVDNIPSAEPERKWIPCNERLPLRSEHVDDMVLVCYGNGSIRFDSCINGEWAHGNPIAWMPLPEPWRGE